MPQTEHDRDKGRKLIGQGIIDGLLQPAGGVILAEDYNQGKGGYWQGSGGSHTQSEGDYHQAVKVEAL
jgi:hypothetical protein